MDLSSLYPCYNLLFSIGYLFYFVFILVDAKWSLTEILIHIYLLISYINNSFMLLGLSHGSKAKMNPYC